MSSVIVVGGGASGMAASYAALSVGHKVILLEKNEKLGKKVYITGKGRCNVTNAEPKSSFFENILTNPKFFYHAFHEFSNEDLMNLMEEAGCHLKIERGKRVFPVSDHASDIIKVWEKLLKKSGCEFHFNSEVTKLSVSENRIQGVYAKENGRNAFYSCDALILATGGLSYPLTGSTGFGHRVLKDMGFTMTETYPSLVSLHTKEQWVSDMAGLTLKNVSISLWDNDKKIYTDTGELLFTHEGLSGPIILSASAHVTEILAKRPLKLNLDLKPALTDAVLDQRMLREFSENQNKNISNVMANLIPRSLISKILELSSVDPDIPCHSISRTNRLQIVKTLKHLVFTIQETGPIEEAIVTKGGLSVKEISAKTYRTHKIPNLYVVGELLDLDGKTGGFNLQIAWSTGITAGRNISESSEVTK